MKTAVKSDPTKYPGLNEDIVIAQGAAFFLAGYLTTAHTLASMTYELAMNPKVQEKALEELNNVLCDSNSDLDDEKLKDLTYMEAVMLETLRKRSPIVTSFRTAIKDCEVCID